MSNEIWSMVGHATAGLLVGALTYRLARKLGKKMDEWSVHVALVMFGGLFAAIACFFLTFVVACLPYPGAFEVACSFEPLVFGILVGFTDTEENRKHRSKVCM